VATDGVTNSATFLDTRFYDALDRLVLEVDNAGHASDLRYDGLGRLAVEARASTVRSSRTPTSIPRRSDAANARTAKATNATATAAISITAADLGRRGPPPGR